MLLVDCNCIVYLDGIVYKFVELLYNEDSIEIVKVMLFVCLLLE